jgi:hypothetical protein
MNAKGKTQLGVTRAELGLSLVIAGLFVLAMWLLGYLFEGRVDSEWVVAIITSVSIILVGIYLLLNIQVREKGLSIKKAPGATLLILVEYLYPPKTVEEVFKPTVADLRIEYFDALKDGKSRKAVWIRIRCTFGFIMAMGLSKALSIIRSVAQR